MKRTNTAKWVESAHRWQIKVQKDGVRKMFTSSDPKRSGQREANAKADAWLEDGIEPSKITFTDAWESYIARCKKIECEGSIRSKESYCRVWFMPTIGNKKLQKITELDIQSIIDDAYSAGLSRQTLLKLKYLLSHFFKYCRLAKLTTFHFESVEIPQAARKKDKTILQPDDLKLLMQNDQTIYFNKQVTDPYIHYYRIAVLTGMRPGELIGLQWDDVHDGYIHIKRSVNVYGVVTQGKNKNARRTVVLPERAKEEIEAQRKETGDQLRVFPISQEHNISRYWKRYCEVNGLTKCTLYELRHTYISIIQTLPEAEVKSLVGHAKGMDTFGVYAHFVNGRTAATKNRLDSVFSDVGI